jgi:hypothetical protein
MALGFKSKSWPCQIDISPSFAKPDNLHQSFSLNTSVFSLPDQRRGSNQLPRRDTIAWFGTLHIPGFNKTSRPCSEIIRKLTKRYLRIIYTCEVVMMEFPFLTEFPSVDDWLFCFWLVPSFPFTFFRYHSPFLGPGRSSIH